MTVLPVERMEAREPERRREREAPERARQHQSKARQERRELAVQFAGAAPPPAPSICSLRAALIGKGGWKSGGRWEKEGRATD